MPLPVTLSPEASGAHLTHHIVDACATSASLWFSMPSLHISLQPALDLRASPYHSLSSTPISFRSLSITSLHLLLGPHWGRACGNQPKSVALGILWSGILWSDILATCPNHSSLSWRKVLDTSQKACTEIEHFPPQMYQDHSGHLQQAAMVRAYHHE